ncbi:hypothetical protein ACOSP7_027243 [Xanthoceras sorbifolium]
MGVDVSRHGSRYMSRTFSIPSWQGDFLQTEVVGGLRRGRWKRLAREVFWMQCSRVEWLKDGDKNTKIFHAKATTRKQNNTMKGLRDC